MDDYKGIDFLDKLYKNLYTSDEVQHTKENNDKRRETLQKYMDRLEKVHKKADTDTKKELIESLYYDKYVIKKENINDAENRELIINGQKKSLKMWLDYLSDENTIYPTWAKYWAFQGMLKMGTYDDIKGIYTKRNSKTISPFVECNPEIVAKCIESIIKLVHDEKIENEITKNDSFSKIYTIYEKKYKSNIIEKSDSNEGIWIKYNKGNKEDAIKLCKSLENKNTGWCTASEEVAIKQLCGPYETEDGGDFYVYYTKDKNDKYTLPRIAIRLNGNYEIGEIRGINKGQNLEEDLINVLLSKLKKMTFISKENIDYNIEIVNNLIKLNKIGQKTQNKENLTDEEIENLYTMRYGFGWTQDPKVEKILKMRNALDDYNSIEDRNIKINMIMSNHLPISSITDKEIMIETVHRRGIMLKYAGEELKKDKELVLEAVKQDGHAFIYIDENLKSDIEIILNAIRKYPDAIKYTSEELKNNKEFMLEVVKQNEHTIRFFSDELKQDKEIIMQAVIKDPIILFSLDSNLRKDKEFMLEVIKNNKRAIKFIDKELKQDKEFMEVIGLNEEKEKTK